MLDVALLYQFVLLTADVWHDIVQDVEAQDTGIACARDGLHGRDEHGVEWTESMLECGEGDSYACGSTVGVGDDEAACGARCKEGLLVQDYQ